MDQSEWRLTKRYSPLKKLRQWLIFTVYQTLKDTKISLSVTLLRSDNLFVRMVNRSCVIVERNLVFNLWAVEKDLSTEALVAEFTNISLHTYISLISFLHLSGRQL